MFTGIIEETGTVRTARRTTRGMQLVVSASAVLEGTRRGDSIATDGVCLTVTDLGDDWFAAEVMGETLDRSTLGGLHPGSRVNLERALALGERLGGHLVAGHVDARGRIVSAEHDGTAIRLTLSAPSAVLRYAVEKGSITIDGVSLTIVAVGSDRLSVSIIPHTRSQTTLHLKRPGDEVNLEADMLVKYVERLLGGTPQRGLSLETLRENGF